MKLRRAEGIGTIGSGGSLLLQYIPSRYQLTITVRVPKDAVSDSSFSSSLLEHVVACIETLIDLYYSRYRNEEPATLLVFTIIVLFLKAHSIHFCYILLMIRESTLIMVSV